MMAPPAGLLAVRGSRLYYMTANSEGSEVLAGLVERVTFHNEENGFCVLRVKARGHKDLLTVIGHAASISAGEWVTASGTWHNDRTHGLQFRAQFLKTSAPTSIEGMEKYLASGMIHGIGPVYAKRLIKTFGDKVFDVIQGTPERLREVDGIGPRRAERIIAAWAEQKIVREIMVFLHAHGVGTSRAVRIYTTSAMPCRSCLKILTGWRRISVASASRPPMRSPNGSASKKPP